MFRLSPNSLKARRQKAALLSDPRWTAERERLSSLGWKRCQLVI